MSTRAWLLPCRENFRALRAGTEVPGPPRGSGSSGVRGSGATGMCAPSRTSARGRYETRIVVRPPIRSSWSNYPDVNVFFSPVPGDSMTGTLHNSAIHHVGGWMEFVDCRRFSTCLSAFSTKDFHLPLPGAFFRSSACLPVGSWSSSFPSINHTSFGLQFNLRTFYRVSMLMQVMENLTVNIGLYDITIMNLRQMCLFNSASEKLRKKVASVEICPWQVMTT